MKNKFMFLMILSLIFGCTGLSYALPFASTVDWTGQIKKGETAMKIGSKASPYKFQYVHSIDFPDQPAQSIDSAILTLSHYGNSANRGKAWFITDSGVNTLKPLWKSTGFRHWMDQSLDLTPLLSGISGDNWTIQFTLYENTTGRDKLWLDKSVLSGTYTPGPSAPIEMSISGNLVPNTTPVPEPGTMLLLGTGLIGLAKFGRRKISKP